MEYNNFDFIVFMALMFGVIFLVLFLTFKFFGVL